MQSEQTIKIIRYIEDCIKNEPHNILFRIFLNRWKKLFKRIDHLQNEYCYPYETEIFTLEYDLYEYGKYTINFNVDHIIKGKNFHNAPTITYNHNSDIINYIYHDIPSYRHPSYSIVLLTDYLTRDSFYCVINGNHQLDDCIMNNKSFKSKYIPFSYLQKEDFVDIYSYWLFTFINEFGRFFFYPSVLNRFKYVRYSKAKSIKV